jgi:hypothetical protein
LAAIYRLIMVKQAGMTRMELREADPEDALVFMSQTKRERPRELEAEQIRRVEMACAGSFGDRVLRGRATFRAWVTVTIDDFNICFGCSPFIRSSFGVVLPSSNDKWSSRPGATLPQIEPPLTQSKLLESNDIRRD